MVRNPCKMTPLTPSRVPLLLETTKVTKPACFVAKIRGRTAFVMEKLLIGHSGALLQQSVMGKIDRSNYIRSIDFGKNSIDRLSGTSEFPSIST
jgi:hypothetical protein